MKILSLAVLLFSTFAQNAFGMYMTPEISKVPLRRVIQNLQGELMDAKEKRGWKHSNILHQIARLYAMAYALGIEDVPIATYDGRDREVAFWKIDRSLGSHMDNLGRELPDPPDLIDQKKDLLRLSAAYYYRYLDLNPKDVMGRVGLGWVLSLDGDKEGAKRVLREAVQLSSVSGTSWLFLNSPKAALQLICADILDFFTKPFGVFYVPKDFKIESALGEIAAAEAYQYLVPLLDSEKDRAEINRLKYVVWRTQFKESLYSRAVTPIAIPISSETAWKKILNQKASVSFDVDGTKRPQKWEWINDNAGWLVYLANPKDKITSGLDLFGNVTFWVFWRDGFEALCSLDDNRDGKITGDEFKNLYVWRDANGNGVQDEGELMTLSSLGVASIQCSNSVEFEHGYKIENGLTLKSGKSAPVYDFVLEAK
jgi:hypothetical protein